MVDSDFDSNTLYYGDNLEVIRKYFPSNSVDLVYLDPPFNTRQITTYSSKNHLEKNR
jgi:adenine-specific DNA methylase